MGVRPPPKYGGHVNAIEVHGLRKSFRRRLRGETIALDGLDLEAPEGGVFGFLGPNGSGKTTTIRCLLGLVAPGTGSCRVLGRPSPAALPAVIDRVGSMVETPALFGGFSGARNLELLARARGIARVKVDDALDRVGLADRAGDRVKTYSLGMKQRLGLAAVLLKDPALLVLDEPANGLDPAGLKEIRDLLRSLAAEGRTVFLSSHLLNEVQLICDRVAIVSRGRTIAAGSVDEVLAMSGARAFVLRCPNLRRAAKILRDGRFPVAAQNEHLLVSAPPKDAGRITKTLAAGGIYLTELRPDEVTLESVFLDLTAESAS
jgi:ABC-2 type transport system ATP-binding protein